MHSFNEEEESMLGLKFHKTSENTRRFNQLVKYIAIGFIGYKAVGKATSISVSFDILNNKISFIIIAVLLIGIIMSLMWGLSEKKLKEQKTQDLTSYIIKLEKRIDSNRSSSHMPSDGNQKEE